VICLEPLTRSGLSGASALCTRAYVPTSFLADTQTRACWCACKDVQCVWVLACALVHAVAQHLVVQGVAALDYVPPEVLQVLPRTAWGA